MAALRWAFAIGVLSILSLSVCRAGEICGYEYCEHGCCDFDESECCTSAIGLIIGLCVAAGVTVCVVIIIICVCRRRRYRGMVYRNHPGATVIVQQGVTANQGGVVHTAGAQPGIIYPPYQPYVAQPYAPQPGMVIAPPAYSGHHQGQPYPPPLLAQAPPAYDSLEHPSMAQGGVPNPGFAEPTKN